MMEVGGRFSDFEAVRTQVDNLDAYFESNQYPEMLRLKLREYVLLTEPIYRCLLYTSPSPRDQRGSRMPSSA